MRPISIELRAFGPYAGIEKVDFEALSKGGLFLICGKTGTGKTMILDAMMFALYGKGSGTLRDDFEAMRCTRADDSTPTYVKFTFENNGEYYCFERRYERKKKNFSMSYSATRKDEEGNWIPLFENAKKELLNSKAEEIIGLKCDQFRQVIVLPQGQFEKLLTSNSADKEAILTSIFGEERWQMIANAMYKEAEQRVSELKNIKKSISSRLDEEGCENIAQFLLLIEAKESELKVLADEYAGKNCDAVIAKMNDALKLADRFRDLHKAENRVAELEGQKAEFAELKDQRKLAEMAEGVGLALKKREEQKKIADKRAADEESAKKSIEAAEEALKETESALKLHLENAEDIERKKEQKAQYDAKRKDYEQLDEAVKALESAKTKTEIANTQASDAESAYKKALENAADKEKHLKALDEECEKITDQYFADIAFEIAGELKEGAPCPVCGSTEHPHPAAAAGNAVTKQMVADKREELKNEREIKAGLDRKAEDAKLLLDQKQAEAVKLKEAVIEAGSRLENLKSNLVEGIGSLEQLERMIAAITKSISDYDKKREDLELKAKTAKETLASAKTGYELAQKEHKNADQAARDAAEEVKSVLAEKGFATEEEAIAVMMSPEALEVLRNKISTYEGNVKATADILAGLKKELKGLKEPDTEQCKAERDRASEEKSKYDSANGSLGSEIKRLRKKYDELMELGTNVEENIHDAEEDLSLAKKLRGDTGIGLQRYVLAIMFSPVVKAANRMLDMVHGGRYQLFRTDEKSQGNKSGLELMVIDKNSAEHGGRFVNTLSGGEKFLASLALSIGMSTVAQKSGIKIEALFIDEGFGSLDEDSIGDAMEILNSIQKANGLVGIISHVKILQDHIGSKLQIVENGQGSHIMQTIG